MVIQDTRNWAGKEGGQGGDPILYVERVKSALEISQELRTPPTAKVVHADHTEGVCVPATRFPRWLRCPKCGRLYPRSEWKKQETEDPICTDPVQGKQCQGTDLEQVQYVMVHPEGFMADVQWDFLAHRDSASEAQEQCRDNTKLSLNFINEKQRWELQCDGCKASREFNDKEPQSFGKANEQPWLYDAPVPSDFSADNKAGIRKVSDSMVYSPVYDSALVIPPESRLRKGAPVDMLYRNANDRKLVDDIEGNVARARTELQRKKASGALDELAQKYRCTVDDIKAAITDIKEGYPYYGLNFTNSRLYEDEYEALLEQIDVLDDEDFVTRQLTDRWRDCIEDDGLPARIRMRAGIVDNLVRVDRLKEVRVFSGFKREGGDRIVPPDITGESGWLPAIELYGEGVFFTLDETALVEWEQNAVVKARLLPLKQRFDDSEREEPARLTARFVLLHTLSHLMIRQLEAAGGYPAASLSERLYCTQTDQTPMAGILIYTTAPDKSGTLGGLAELSEPKRFLRMLSQALDHADWCSSDPVCREHEGQGPDLLNLAACHACTLIPDTACTYGNVLLDRTLVKGDSETNLPSLFNGGDA
jgi:hypothetical protein